MGFSRTPGYSSGLPFHATATGGLAPPGAVVIQLTVEHEPCSHPARRRAGRDWIGGVTSSQLTTAPGRASRPVAFFSRASCCTPYACWAARPLPVFDCLSIISEAASKRKSGCPCPNTNRFYLQGAQLSVPDRLRLIDELPSSVPNDQPPTLSGQWLAEIERRSAEIDSGAVTVE